ncbi:S1C family serine protease [Deinococcus radiomollis]|uniref:S1C family serine protease n=1 Tax=Deinococcus radiomollis TaxID=468916 RepID=UPI0038913431
MTRRRSRFSPWPVVLLLGALAAYLSPQWNGSQLFGLTPPEVSSSHRTAPGADVPIPAALSADARKLFNEVRPASVQIEQLGTDGSGGLGSGFFISDTGLLLTAYHVVDGARIIRVRTVSDKVFPASVVGFDNAADVALLQIQTRGKVPFLPLAARLPRVGEKVLAVGNSRGDFLQPRRGRLLALNAEAGRADFPEGTLEMSAPLAPGDSGGPILNTAGQAVGVVSYVRVDGDGNTLSSYAVPVTSGEGLIAELKSGLKRDVPAIGLYFDTVHDGATNPPGGVIGGVVQGSPAARAGLIGLTRGADQNVKGFGDVIVSVDGVRTRSADDAIYEIRRRQIGQTVTLTVDRNGVRRAVRLPLVAKGSLSFSQP